MLVLSRKIQDSFFINVGNEQIEIKIIDVCSWTKTTLVGIEAPKHMSILRDDVINKAPKNKETDSNE